MRCRCALPWFLRDSLAGLRLGFSSWLAAIAPLKPTGPSRWCLPKSGRDSATNSSPTPFSLGWVQCVSLVQYKYSNNASHAIGCAMMRRTALTKRHDGIAECLPSHLEPHVDDERLKLDVNGSTFFLDVSLDSPLPPTCSVHPRMHSRGCARGSNTRSPSTPMLNAKLAVSSSHSFSARSATKHWNLSAIPWQANP